MEQLTLISATYLDDTYFEVGVPVTFDGTRVTLGAAQFPGYRDAQGSLRITSNKTPEVHVALNVTLDPVVLVGATVVAVQGMRPGSETVQILTDRGTLSMSHSRECCEEVQLVDVVGDPEDLVDGIIVVFEVRVGKMGPETWKTYTFYEIRTTRGDVTLRWGEPLGSNDNRYGEAISLFLEP